MTSFYPGIEPYKYGLLDVGNGHQLYWELCGNPACKPALVLHGGPGSGCSPTLRRFFNPDVYHIVLFDQRNSGRSTPHAKDFNTDLIINTTEHLLADIEQLRQHLGIERWLVFGGSWGVTLGLAYAQRHPQRVTEMVLLGITMTRRAEIDWLYHGVGRLFPEQHACFRAGVPAAERDGDLVAAYYRLLQNPDPTIHRQAAYDWCVWEASLISTDPDYVPDPRWSDPDFQLAFARIVTHYFHHNAWLDDGILLRNAGRLAGIPGVLVHGRLDLDAPLITAWELNQAWSDSELIVVSGAGHSLGDSGMSEALIAATDRFAMN